MVDTRESLLNRLKIENAHDAWKEFYELYWGAILRYALKLGLSPHQAEEVLQETMVVLMRLLPQFAYDPRRGRFRNFLLTIVHRRSLAIQRRFRRESNLTWEQARDIVDPFVNGSEEAEARNRWRGAICEEALRRLRQDDTLGEHTFAAFFAYVVEKRSAADVAAEFGLNENAVYQIKNRLLRRLQREVSLLLRDSGTEESP